MNAEKFEGWIGSRLGPILWERVAVEPAPEPTITSFLGSVNPRKAVSL